MQKSYWRSFNKLWRY